MPDRADARLTLHPDFHRGRLDRRLFGSFVEHMGRCVYGGIHDPGHPTADAAGFRGDVEDLVTELGTTLVRYPGGNFVSGYDWEDGVGPRAERPTRLDLAWRSVETNAVGTDEFLAWAARRHLEPMMAVNLGTRGVAEAAALVEYCNIEGGTRWSDLRRANGTPDPHRVGLWCLGNEMDGAWQTGHKTAEDYGKLAAQAGRAMRRVDPTIELVACGSSTRQMATFGSWETTVLDHTLDVVDYLSVHAYYDGRADRAEFLASGAAMESYISEVVATADAVTARRGSDKRMMLAFDEWNVWSSSPQRTGHHDDTAISRQPPISEDPYQVLDAVVLGDLLIALLNHADRVRVACLSLLVNVSAPIRTEPGGPAWAQATFEPMAVTTGLAHGHSLDVRTTGPEVTGSGCGDVPAVGVAATHDPETGALAVFLTNRAQHPLTVCADLRAFGAASLLGTWSLSAADAAVVAPGPVPRLRGDTARAHVVDGDLSILLPPQSWTAVSLASTAGGAGGAGGDRAS